jgi:hypothetical protein
MRQNNAFSVDSSLLADSAKPAKTAEKHRQRMS